MKTNTYKRFIFNYILILYDVCSSTAIIEDVSPNFDTGIVDDSKFVFDKMDFNSSVNVPLLTKILYPFILIANIFL